MAVVHSTTCEIIDFRSYRQDQPSPQRTAPTTDRKDRRDNFRYAQQRLEFHQVLRKLSLLANCPNPCPESKPFKHLSYHEVLDDVRCAARELFFTPAPTREALAAKRAVFKRYNKWTDEIRQSIEQAFACDEAWLAVNARPAKRLVQP